MRDRANRRSCTAMEKIDMQFKDILIQFESYPEPTPHAAIDAAVAFAKAVEGRLTAVAVRIDIPLASNRIADRLINLSGIKAEAESASDEACHAAIGRFESEAKAAGVYGDGKIETVDLYDVGEHLARWARTRDLCMVPLNDGVYPQADFTGQLIFQSGRPVLAFRSGRPILSDGRLGRVAVAWDGSRAAARSLADALPLLQRAASVDVVTFTGEKEAARPGIAADVVRHLGVYGIEAAAQEVESAGRRIGQAMDDYLARRPADLLVMGAYGHSRMLEFVLGGATEHALRAPPTALFLSH